MSNPFYQHDAPVSPGTTIRSDKYNGDMVKVETGFELAKQVMDLKIEMPDGFAGSTKLPALENESIFYVNESGNFSFLPIGTFNQAVSDVEGYSIAAAQSATDASGHATTASNHATTAGGHATSAGNSATTASGHATTATNAATTAQDWASKAVDSIVSGGLYSSLHYATKASEHEAAAFNHVGTAQYWAQEAEAVVTSGDVVPTSRTINGKTLDANISLNSADVGALPSDGKALDAANLNGAAESTSAEANTIVKRLSSGDVLARLFRSTYATTNSDVQFIMTQIDQASNNYIRPTTPAQFRAGVTDGYYRGISWVPAWTDVTGKPVTATRWPDWLEVTGKPSFAAVATSGSYNDLSNKPTLSSLGGVPTTRTVNGKALSVNISLTATDVGALPTTWTPSWSQVSSKPDTATRWPAWTEVTSKPTTFTPSAHGHGWAEISGKPDTATRWPTAAEAGAVPVADKVFGDHNSTSQTITRQGKITRYRSSATGNITKTIDASTFGEDDIIELVKLRQSGALTVTVDAGTINLPDGTNGASHTLEAGYHGTITLEKTGSNFELSISG